jgi:transglutaminase-like putative cysteine protease
MTRYRITHRTEYRYGSEVTRGYTVTHLTPRATASQHVHHTTIDADPPAAQRSTHRDAFGNGVTFLEVQQPHEGLRISATSEVSVVDPPPWPEDGPAWNTAAATLTGDTSAAALLARECRLDSPLVARSRVLAEYASPSFPPGRPLVDAVAHLCRRIHAEFVFDPGFSDVSTPPEVVLAHRRGVCQDFAHLTIGCLRGLGLPARYVSGYIETDPPPGGEKLVGSDASHAWCSVYVPGHGWLDLDPTNDQVPPRRHVTVAWGRDYGDVAPVRGVVFGQATTQELSVAVDMTALDGGVLATGQGG